jgi:hypothetical protein
LLLLTVAAIVTLPISVAVLAIVVGTFDHEVWSWWLTFRDGHSYPTDACITTVPSAEVERRLISFARTWKYHSPKDSVSSARSRPQRPWTTSWI